MDSKVRAVFYKNFAIGKRRKLIHIFFLFGFPLLSLLVPLITAIIHGFNYTEDYYRFQRDLDGRIFSLSKKSLFAIIVEDDDPENLKLKNAILNHFKEHAYFNPALKTEEDFDTFLPPPLKHQLSLKYYDKIDDVDNEEDDNQQLKKPEEAVEYLEEHMVGAVVIKKRISSPSGKTLFQLCLLNRKIMFRNEYLALLTSLLESFLKKDFGPPNPSYLDFKSKELKEKNHFLKGNRLQGQKFFRKLDDYNFWERFTLFSGPIISILAAVILFYQLPWQKRNKVA